MVQKGDTFLIPSPQEDECAHLHVVISDPEKEPDGVVLVPITTWESYKDESCLLQPGDHPFIKHASCVQYRDARIVPAARLARAIAGGQIRSREPVSSELLARILAGAGESRFLPAEHGNILARQGLIT
jgi:hypothetical protein